MDSNSNGTCGTAHESFAGYEGDDFRLSSKTFFCDHTTIVVTEFLKKGKLPMYQKQDMHGRDFSEDEHILLQSLSHLNMLDWQLNEPEYDTDRGKVFLQDKLLEAVRLMRKNKHFPTWAIFACQSFVDTRRELGAQLARGFDDFVKQGSRLIQAWNDCLESGKTNHINRSHKDNDANIQHSIIRLKKAIDDDFVQDLIDDSFEDHPGASEKYNWGKNFLLKNHPLLCGIILQDGLVAGHRNGTRIAADQGPVRTAIHLSHAVSMAGYAPIGRAWADLDYIIEKHGDAHLFVGSKPAKLKDCYRHMGLAFGQSASTYSLNKNRKADSQDLKFTGKERDPYSWQKLHRRIMPMARYVQAYEEKDIHKLKPTRAAEDTFVMMEWLVNRLMSSKDMSCPASPYNEKTVQKTRHMTPLQSLTIFKQALKEDDFPLRLDLMSLNWRCTQLLRRIQKICIEQSPLEYPSEKWGGDSALNGIICHMFASLTGVRWKQPGRFHEACALVVDVMAREGNAEYLKAEALMTIKQGPVAASALSLDLEDLEDPMQNFVPPMLRKHMPEYTTEELSAFKSRAEGAMFPVVLKDPGRTDALA